MLWRCCLTGRSSCRVPGRRFEYIPGDIRKPEKRPRPHSPADKVLVGLHLRPHIGKARDKRGGGEDDSYVMGFVFLISGLVSHWIIHGQITAQFVVDLLLSEDLLQPLRGCLVYQGPVIHLLQKAAHFPGDEVVVDAPVFPLGVPVLPVELGADHAQLQKRLVDGHGAVVAEQRIGGAAVTDGDHQLAQLSHGQRDVPVEKLDRAAAGDLLIFPDGDGIVEAGLSPGLPEEDGRHQRQLDDAGRQIGLRVPIAPGLSAHQAVVVDAGLAGKAPDLLQNGLFCTHMITVLS